MMRRLMRRMLFLVERGGFCSINDLFFLRDGMKAQLTL